MNSTSMSKFNKVYQSFFGVGAVIFVIFFGHTANAQTVIGPESFERNAGGYIVDHRQFEFFQANASCQMQLYLFDMADDDYDRVSQSRINLNGEFVVNDGALRVGKSFIEVPVKLKKKNQLSVELHGKQGGRLAVKFVCSATDRQPPAITVNALPKPNNQGWYNVNPSVQFHCEDQQSKISKCTETTKISTQGKGQVITGMAQDMSGNTANASITLNIDKSPPKISAITKPSSNFGWNNTDTTVSFECSDDISGVVNCTPSKLFNSEISGHVIKGTAVDRAGNKSSTRIILNIDKTMPDVTAEITPQANAQGWHNRDVTIRYHCADELSGLVQCPTEVFLDSQGARQIVKQVVSDKAGNSKLQEVIVNIDKTPPQLTIRSDSPANSNGWHNENIKVLFTCDDEFSGVADCPEDMTLNKDGAEQTITKSIHDRAGNKTEQSASFNLDKTAPHVRAVANKKANSFGWYNSDVTVQYECEDVLAGIELCPEPVTVSTQGAEQIVKVEARDKAGNVSVNSMSISLDKTEPSLKIQPNVPANNRKWHKSDVRLDFTCSDLHSGIETCPSSKLVSQQGENQLHEASVSDRAGNTTQNAVVLNIDKTLPAIEYSLDHPANKDKWHNKDVTISFTCKDEGSGIDTCSEEVTIRNEGADQKTRARAVDVAGNERFITATLNIDKTPPVLYQTLSAPPNENNWYNKDVTISYRCEDKISGVADCPSSTFVNKEAKNKVFSKTISDVAGNKSSGSSTISLDKTKPKIVAILSSKANKYGWHNAQVKINYKCSDALSGVAQCPPSELVDRSVLGEVIQSSTKDLAGNENSTRVTLNIDKESPRIVASIKPKPNSSGWNTTDVNVSFKCFDTGAGVENCNNDILVSSEGARQVVQGTATDKADNKTTTVAKVNIDKTIPVIKVVHIPPPDQNGWNNTNVKVRFECEDSISGIAICPEPIDVTKVGANQLVTVDAQDNAGNQATITHTVNIDNVNPTIEAVVSPKPNKQGWNNSDVTIKFNCDDVGTGIALCNKTITASDEGKDQIIEGKALDQLGNSAVTQLNISIDKTPPFLQITSPGDSQIFDKLKTTIEGKVSDNNGIQFVKINGVKAYLDEDNRFKFEVLLLEGRNRFEIEATDVAGNKKEEVVNMVYKPKLK